MNLLNAEIFDGCYLRIDKTSAPSIARIYFVDSADTEISVPESIVVWDDIRRVPMRKLPGHQSYAICTTDKYTIECNQKQLFVLTPQKGWDIYRSMS